MLGFCFRVWSLSFAILQMCVCVCAECGHVCIHKAHFRSSPSLVPRPLVFTTLGTLAVLASLYSGVVLLL